MIDLRRMLTETRPNSTVAIVRWLLRLCSLPYRAAMAVRNAAFRLGILKVHRVGIPVISVGNLSVGGTGKTPAVAWLARHLSDHNLRVAIISRGYGQLADGRNDEALELQLRLSDVPHIQNIDRVAATRSAEKDLGAQVAVLDDGFQHRRLARDLDIVLIDATDPPDAHWVLPGGLLREPFTSLSRADIVILTRVDQATLANVARIQRRVVNAAPRATLATARHKPRNLRIHPGDAAPLDSLRGKNILAFCGIGNPEKFFDSLINLNMQVVATRCWPDHHHYSADDIQELAAWTRQFPDTSHLVCTMKDWVKLRMRNIGDAQLAAVEIELEILSGREEIETKLQPLIGQSVEKAVASISAKH